MLEAPAAASGQAAGTGGNGFAGGSGPPSGATTPRSVSHADRSSSVLPRKVFMRLYRDLRLRTGTQVQYIMPILAAIASISVLLAFLQFWTKLDRQDQRWEPHDRLRDRCRCPIFGDATYPETFLADASAVLRVHPKGPTQDKKLLLASIDEVYRGPMRLPDYPLALPLDRLKECALSSVPEEMMETGVMEDRGFVVASGLITGISRQKAALGLLEQSSQLGLTQPLECGQTLLIPWRAFAPDTAESLSSEGLLGDSWWRYAEVDDPNGRSQHMQQEWWIQNGTTLVATCMDQRNTLVAALKSWLAVSGVDEIIIVDWLSASSIVTMLTSVDDTLLQDPRIVIVNVKGHTMWSEAQGGNVGFSMSTRTNVLHVRCDAIVPKDFLTKHEMDTAVLYRAPVMDDNFVQPHPELRGVLYMRRADIMAVNGFDERLDTFGYFDDDLAHRISTSALVAVRFIDPSGFSMAPAGDDDVDLRVFSVLNKTDAYAEEAELNRNRLLLTSYGITPWNHHSRNVFYTSSMQLVPRKSRNGSALKVYTLTASNLPLTFNDALGESKVEEASRRALRFVLTKLGSSSTAMPIDSLRRALSYRSAPDKYVTVLVRLEGGCAARLLSYATLLLWISERDADAPPLYVRAMWRRSPECACKFSVLFKQLDIDVLENENAKVLVNSSEALFPTTGFEVVRDFSQLSERNLQASETFLFNASHIHIDDERMLALRRILTSVQPSEETKTRLKQQSSVGSTPETVEVNADLDRNFFTMWRGALTEDAVNQLMLRLVRPDNPVDDAFGAKLFDGCDASAPELMSQYPELSLIFAALRKPSARCLSS